MLLPCTRPPLVPFDRSLDASSEKQCMTMLTHILLLLLFHRYMTDNALYQSHYHCYALSFSQYLISLSFLVFLPHVHSSPLHLSNAHCAISLCISFSQRGPPFFPPFIVPKPHLLSLFFPPSFSLLLSLLLSLSFSLSSSCFSEFDAHMQS